MSLFRLNCLLCCGDELVRSIGRSWKTGIDGERNASALQFARELHARTVFEQNVKQRQLGRVDVQPLQGCSVAHERTSGLEAGLVEGHLQGHADEDLVFDNHAAAACGWGWSH